MKKGIFTVIFMVMITVFFIFILAFVNEAAKNRIVQNTEIQRIRSILYACNVLPEGVEESALSPTSTTQDIPWHEQDLLKMVEDRLRSVRLPIKPSQRALLENSFLSLQDSVELIVLLNEEGEIDGYGFPLRGRGLWGTISAVAVISSDLKHMIGIDFTDQVETPGLGARIMETGFKYFFRGLDLGGFLDQGQNQTPIVMVGKKDKTNIELSTNSIMAITGATQTCNGVLNMINSDLKFYMRSISESRDEIKNKILSIQ